MLIENYFEVLLTNFAPIGIWIRFRIQGYVVNFEKKNLKIVLEKQKCPFLKRSLKKTVRN